LLLHLHRTTHRSVDAIENDKQGVAAGLNDPATMLINRGINYVGAKPTQPLECPGVIQTNQTAVADHIGVDYGNQPSTLAAKQHAGLARKPQSQK
jgi:hypothetical protein